jgi:GAF domain-containing protein
VALLDCAEAGLLLADASGGLRVMASSSERSDTLDLLQSQHEEGPCFECYHCGRAIFSEDLGRDSARWPRFAPAAVHRGFRSVQAVPMRVRGQTVGALNLFRTTVGRIDERDMPLGQGLADIGAIALLQQRAVREARGVVQQLQDALNSRVVIEQAKGVLAERGKIDMDAAFGRMRAYSRAGNRRLGDVAEEIINNRMDAAELENISRAPSAED